MPHDSGNLIMHPGDTDELLPIDKMTTGVLRTPITMCSRCPTPYDVLSGDMTRD